MSLVCIGLMKNPREDFFIPLHAVFKIHTDIISKNKNVNEYNIQIEHNEKFYTVALKPATAEVKFNKIFVSYKLKKHPPKAP